MKTSVTPHDILSRGISHLTDPEKKLETFLSGDRPKGSSGKFMIKFGVDPTRPDIHLGHAAILHKLRKFQDRGATVIFLIGDFTAMIGDPTGKSKVRPEISQADVEANMKTYLDQVGKILDLSPEKFSWMRNSDWFTSVSDIVPDGKYKVAIDGKPVEPRSFIGKAIAFERTRMQATHMKLPEVHTVSLINFLSILRRITHARLIERDMFQDRINKNEELYLHEFMYPVFQAIDSHVLARVYGSCDLEIGGTDQVFNMLMGRDVMKMTGQPQQAVMAIDLLEGIDGKEKMSKSLGNYIGIAESGGEIYGKVMSVPDALIPRYAELATFTPMEDIAHMKELLASSGVNPRDLKMALARQIVAIYHGEEEAKRAEEGFIRTFRDKGIPEDMPTFTVTKGMLLGEALISHEILSSKTIFKRHIAEGAILEHGGEKITDPGCVIDHSMVVKVGKKTFVKFVIR